MDEQPVANIQLDDSCKIERIRRFISHLWIISLDKSLIVELSVYIKENVLSEAALECTQKVIEINEGHYTAW